MLTIKRYTTGKAWHVYYNDTHIHSFDTKGEAEAFLSDSKGLLL